MTHSIELKPKIKILVAGYERVGKTALVSCFKDGKFEEGCMANNSVENFDMDFEIEIENVKRTVILNIWDGGYRDDYGGRLYPLYFPETNVFILCFSVVDNLTFEKCVSTFAPMFLKHSKDVPVILAGLKSDLREDSEFLRKNQEEYQKTTVGYNEGVELVKKMKWEKYVECSSKLNHNVKEVFTEAVSSAVKKMYSKKDPNEKCNIM